MKLASGSLILYATEPGSFAADGKGNNGVFTSQLVDAINQDGYSIEKVFKVTARNVSQATAKKQVPYIEGVVLGEFYFGTKEVVKPAPESIRTANINPDITGIEKDFWSDVRSDLSKAMYEAYLEQYPNGHYVRIARIKFAVLNKSTDTTTGQPETSNSVNTNLNTAIEADDGGSFSVTGSYIDNYDRVYEL
jgi:hypothetical protein